MAEHPAPSPRPYFIPPSLDHDALPDDCRRELVNIIGPAYQNLVERALTANERSAAVTLVFLLTMEVLDQFALARATDFSILASAAAAHKRDNCIESHLRLIYAKQISARFMPRLNLLRQCPQSHRTAQATHLAGAIMENRNSVDQRRQTVTPFIAVHRARLARQGSLVSIWRLYAAPLEGELPPAVQIGYHDIDSQGLIAREPLRRRDDPKIRGGVRTLFAREALRVEEQARHRASVGRTARQLTDEPALATLLAGESEWTPFRDSPAMRDRA